MTEIFKIGEQAQLVQPIIRGEVADIRYNKDAASLELLLNYKDADGAPQSRWFLTAQLESAQ